MPYSAYQLTTNPAILQPENIQSESLVVPPQGQLQSEKSCIAFNYSDIDGGGGITNMSN